MAERLVVDLNEVGAADVASAGGKGAGLGELMRIDGVSVPAGFCVTTEAFERIVGPVVDDGPAAILQISPPADLVAAVTEALARHGEADAAWAVRSSATAEDTPTASFAGQQDTYLNIRGAAAVLERIVACWASLFTERAVVYRRRNGFDDRKVRMAVVVQRMVDPRASGVLFTADPITGNRKVSTVDAVAGLGEDLVSGLVNPHAFKLRDDKIIEGETEGAPLTEAQVVELARLGRKIEAHFGVPQDIEWCRDESGFRIVQSRPITTLFPLPANPGGGNRVYLSVGHQQMMTDAMKPLGISMWQMTAMATMLEAGARLFVDATDRLASPSGRGPFLDMVGRGDPLIRDALETVIDRGFVKEVPGPAVSPVVPPAPPGTDPSVAALIERSEASIAALARDIQGKTGPELFDFLEEAFREHKRMLADPDSLQAIMAGMGATWWLNDHLEEWLGEKNVADTLTLSAPGNITSEMGLDLLDVADALRPYEKLLSDVDFPEGLPPEPRRVVHDYLDRYGMRCAGEIDITRTRWSERPSILVPLILDNIRLFGPGEGRRRFEEGRLRAESKRQDVLERLRALPDGAAKADETARMIDRLRTYIGYREYPKYAIICRYFIYKKALMAEAENNDDVFYLTFQELRDGWDDELIERRKEEFRAYRTLPTPRVLTSEGESISGAYRRESVPEGSLIGLPVSAGTVEGRARVILDMADADLEAGDILVTAFTDPSWSPLFVAVSGLVTEVGGLMTHGAVIAREYGLPAVVGVADATRLIADGQRIRVHGTEGYVEILS
jgi:rifampicin phosphotransferase